MPKKLVSVKSSMIFEVNKPEVVAEVIEGELVIIHLGDGYYYHGNTYGSYIWTLVTHNNTVGEMVSELVSVTGEKAETVESEVVKYISLLLKEKLIRQAGKKDRLPLKEKLDVLASKESPTLKKHADMKELLLLDPIHDVGDASWPLEDVK